MERRQLEYFVAVVEHRGFGRAASALHVSQPTLSRAIQNLERELGVLLFRRTNSGIVITETADRLVRRARTILREIESMSAAARVAATDIAGQVSIALTPAPAIEPMTTIITTLQERYPAVTTVGHAHSDPSAALAAVDKGTCEVALFGQAERPSAPGIVARQLYLEELYLVLPPGSSLAQSEHITPQDLAGMPLIVTAAGTTLRRLFAQLSEQLGGLTVAARASHRSTILPLVARGVGSSILPGSYRRAAELEGVVMKSFTPPYRVPMWMIHQERLGPAARVFAETALEVGRAHV